MYQGEPDAVAFLGSPLYWKYMKQRKVWVGKGQVTEAYEYTTSRYGWASSELCINEMIKIKIDDYCDTPDNPKCACYASPEQWWSLPPMTPKEESDWLKYEDPGYEGQEKEFKPWYEWWEKNNFQNNLIREEADAVVSG